MNHSELLMVRKALNKRKAAGENVKSLITANERLIRESRAARNADSKGPVRRRRVPERAPSEPIVPRRHSTLCPRTIRPRRRRPKREKRISERFSTLERMASRLVENKIPALIISGPPGLGKSFTLEKKAEELEGTSRPVTIISGSISAPGC